MPLGIEVLLRQPGPALSTGPVSSVEVAAGPSAWRGGEMRRGQRRPIVSGKSASATRQQSDGAGLLSVGFSTRSTRMPAACPPRNTRPSLRLLTPDERPFDLRERTRCSRRWIPAWGCQRASRGRDPTAPLLPPRGRRLKRDLGLTCVSSPTGHPARSRRRHRSREGRWNPSPPWWKFSKTESFNRPMLGRAAGPSPFRYDAAEHRDQGAPSSSVSANLL